MILRKDSVGMGRPLAQESAFLSCSLPGYSFYLSSRSMRLYHPDYRNTPQGFLIDTGDSVLLQNGPLRHYWHRGADPP
jgi:hypothetical protein